MIDMLLGAVANTTGGFGGPIGIWNAIVHDFSNITDPVAFATFVQVLMIDLVLAGDNAIVVGALAAGLPADQRKKVIMIGVLAALVLRILFALIVTQLMQIIGLILVGGLLLLWVAWRMWRDLHHEGESWGSEEIVGDEHAGLKPAKSFIGAAWAVAGRTPRSCISRRDRGARSPPTRTRAWTSRRWRRARMPSPAATGRCW